VVPDWMNAGEVFEAMFVAVRSLFHVPPGFAGTETAKQPSNLRAVETSVSRYPS